MSWPYEQREAVDARASQDLTLRREKEVTGKVTETVAPSLPQKPPGYLVETPSPPCLALSRRGLATRPFRQDSLELGRNEIL